MKSTESHEKFNDLSLTAEWFGLGAALGWLRGWFRAMVPKNPKQRFGERMVLSRFQCVGDGKVPGEVVRRPEG